MILVLLILAPILAGLLAWPLARRSTPAARWLCLGTMALCGVATALVWIIWSSGSSPGHTEFDRLWIPQFGIHFALAMDGLSLLLVALTCLLGFVAVLASWKGITKRQGFYYFNLMWLLGSLVGVFEATDLFLFYFFWEMMLMPLYLLIGIWGHERRIYATIKFFLFTQAGSLLMLLAILGLYFAHGRTTGVYTFDYRQLIGTVLPEGWAIWLMLGFLAAFLVKLPVFGLHTWLPDAHTEAPTAGSVVLAGLVLKAGAYGLLRFAIPLFPQAMQQASTALMALAVAGIIYGAMTAFGQTDLKRLVAYTSVSHMGFVLLGLAAAMSAGTSSSAGVLAVCGAVVVMLAHGLSTGALFVIVGELQDRIHTRDLARMGGLWAAAPRMGGSMMFFSLASLGLPGLANFVGEFLVLLGTYQTHPYFAAAAAAGLILSVVYSLWMVQKAFHGPRLDSSPVPDFGLREMAMMVILMAGTVALGVYPKPVIDQLDQTLVEHVTLGAPPSAPLNLQSEAKP